MPDRRCIKKVIMAGVLAMVLAVSAFSLAVSGEMEPTVPSGSAYKVSVNDITPFARGDIITVTLTITDIQAAGGLLGLDLDLVYDPAYLTPVRYSDGKFGITTSVPDIMQTYAQSKWTATTRLDGAGTAKPTLVMKQFSDAEIYATNPEKEVAIKKDGELWFSVLFTALKPSDGNVIAYTEAAAGTDNNTNGVTGRGVVITSPGQQDAVVSGTVTSFHSDTDPVTVALYADLSGPAVYSTTVFGNNAAYEIKDVAAGSYTVKISKKDHVTRAYAITVGEENVIQNAVIHLLGDVNGDGKITVLDVGRANSHAKGVTLLSGYELACADTVKSDGQVTAVDVARINAHAKGASLLW